MESKEKLKSHLVKGQGDSNSEKENSEGKAGHVYVVPLFIVIHIVYGQNNTEGSISHHSWHKPCKRHPATNKEPRALVLHVLFYTMTTCRCSFFVRDFLDKVQRKMSDSMQKQHQFLSYTIRIRTWFERIQFLIWSFLNLRIDFGPKQFLFTIQAHSTSNV